jgi:hypothetical protein
MKKSQSIIAMFLVLLAGSLIVTGCSPDTEIEYVETAGGVIPFDAVVYDEPSLNAALSNSGVVYILVKDDVALTADLSIPSSKRLYLYAKLDPASSDLTVEGKVVVAETGSLIATNSGVVTVTGSVSVEEGGSLSIDDPASVNDGAGNTVLGGKATFAGGALVYAAGSSPTSVSAIETALGYVSSGVLEIPTGSGLKPSEAAGISGISSTKWVKIDLGSTAEDAPELTIPVGLDITTTATLTSLTSLTVHGKLSATSGKLSNSGAVLVVGQGTEVELGTIAKLNTGSSVAAGSTLTAIVTAFDDTASLAIGAGATVNGITFPDATSATALAANKVTIGDYDLSGALNIETGSELIVTGDFGLVGTMQGGSYEFTGDGKLITSGDGVLLIGPHGGFTTKPEGITNNLVMNSAGVIITEMAGTKVLANSKGASTITLTTAFANPAVPAIGSVTLENTNATTIQNTTDGSTDTDISIGMPTAVCSFLDAVTATGDAVTGTNAADIKDATFTLTLRPGASGGGKFVQIKDGGYTGDVPKYGVVTFSGVKLTYNNIISPEFAPFSVGVITQR